MENLDDDEGSGHSVKSFYLVLPPKIEYKTYHAVSGSSALKTEFVPKRFSLLEEKTEEQKLEDTDITHISHLRLVTDSTNILDHIENANPDIEKRVYEKARIFKTIPKQTTKLAVGLRYGK